MNNLEWLQYFYLDLCDGDWEELGGLELETLGNPGFSFKFALKDTVFEDLEFKEIQDLRSEHDWIMCKCENNFFEGSGGPLNLDEIIGVFRKWIVESDIENPPFIPSAGGHEEDLKKFIDDRGKNWREK